jgi:MFS family permease
VPDAEREGTSGGGRAFPWAVFVLSFALAPVRLHVPQRPGAGLSLIRRDWAASDAQLGALTGVVALVVGALAVPLSLLGDRIGRVRALQGMALLWSLATLACALAASYGQLLAARLVLGVGEAAYGSVGLAVVLAVFPPYRRALLTGTFLAGGAFGAVLGLALGGVLTAWCAYLGSGLQLFAAGALITWLPTYVAGVYGLSTARAALVASAVILSLTLGVVGCGWATTCSVATGRSGGGRPPSATRWPRSCSSGPRPPWGRDPRSWRASPSAPSSWPARPAPPAPWSRA